MRKSYLEMNEERMESRQREIPALKIAKRPNPKLPNGRETKRPQMPVDAWDYGFGQAN